MHITNQTKQILVFGTCRIAPSESGELTPEFDDHPVVDLILRTKRIGPVGSSHPKGHPKGDEVLEAPTPVIEFESDDTIPPAWDEWHGVKANGWIGRQTNIELLAKMVAIEPRPKVRERLEKRIEMLEGTA